VNVISLFERRLCRRHPGGRFGRGAEPPSEEAHAASPAYTAAHWRLTLGHA